LLLAAALAGVAVAGVASAAHHPAAKPAGAKPPSPKPGGAKAGASKASGAKLAAAPASLPASAPVATPASALVDTTPDPAKVVASYLDNLAPPPAHESIRNVVAAHRAELDDCLFGSAVHSDGRVVVRFHVSATGVAADAEVALDELDDPMLSDCLVKSLLSLSYSREGGAETEVVYPIVIQSGAIQYPEEAHE